MVLETDFRFFSIEWERVKLSVLSHWGDFPSLPVTVMPVQEIGCTELEQAGADSDKTLLYQ